MSVISVVSRSSVSVGRPRTYRAPRSAGKLLLSNYYCTVQPIQLVLSLEANVAQGVGRDEASARDPATNHQKKARSLSGDVGQWRFVASFVSTARPPVARARPRQRQPVCRSVIQPVDISLPLSTLKRWLVTTSTWRMGDPLFTVIVIVIIINSSFIAIIHQHPSALRSVVLRC